MYLCVLCERLRYGGNALLTAESVGGREARLRLVDDLEVALGDIAAKRYGHEGGSSSSS